MGEIHTLEDKLAELGPSPHVRYRRAKLLQSSWDAFQCLGVGAMSLYFLALENEELRCPATGSGSNASLRTVPPPHCASWSAHAMVIWREGTADPLEAVCAWFTNMFLISMCGNSPLAYLVAAGFASVNDRMWFDWIADVFERWGHTYEGGAAYALGGYAFAFFFIPYIVHGLLLLPLELWEPAMAAGRPFKIQPNKRIPRNRVLPAIAHAIAELITIGLPYIGCVCYITKSSLGTRGVRFEGGLPRYTERASMLLLHLLVNEACPSPPAPHPLAAAPCACPACCPSSPAACLSAARLPLPPRPLLPSPRRYPGALLLRALGLAQGRAVQAHPQAGAPAPPPRRPRPAHTQTGCAATPSATQPQP